MAYYEPFLRTRTDAFLSHVARLQDTTGRSFETPGLAFQSVSSMAFDAGTPLGPLGTTDEALGSATERKPGDLNMNAAERGAWRGAVIAGSGAFLGTMVGCMVIDKPKCLIPATGAGLVSFIVTLANEYNKMATEEEKEAEKKKEKEKTTGPTSSRSRDVGDDHGSGREPSAGDVGYPGGFSGPNGGGGMGRGGDGTGTECDPSWPGTQTANASLAAPTLSTQVFCN